MVFASINLCVGSPLNLAAAAVTAVQWLAAAQQNQVQVPQNSNPGAVDNLTAQQNTLQEQIRESEQNLSAQHAVRTCLLLLV